MISSHIFLYMIKSKHIKISLPLLSGSPIWGIIGSGISLDSNSVDASWCGTNMFKLDFCRATVDGNSVKRNDSCLLKGEFTLNIKSNNILIQPLSHEK